LDFYKYLKKCRENCNITQEELVSELYLHDKKIFESLDAVTLSRWERNMTKPNTAKKLSIIKYFQKQSEEALPCWENYSTEEVEDLICTAGISNLLGKTSKLVLNFPSEMMHIDEIKVYPIVDNARAETLFALHMDLHRSISHTHRQVTPEQVKLWAEHPSSFFLIAEYKGAFAGLFFSLRVKEEVFAKIQSFEMKHSEIEECDFALNGENGSIILLSFYALNHKVASMLFMRYYAYLIANQKHIRHIGVSTALPEVHKTVENMNLKEMSEKHFEDGVLLKFYAESLREVLATEYVVKMIFSE